MKVVLCAVMLAALCGCVASRAKGAQTAEPQDPQKLFERRCGGCHSLDKDKEGPRLRGVYGRRAGSVAGFDYSAALKSANVRWDDVTLDKWLTDTGSVVKGNDMDFSVRNKAERTAIIAFLKSAAAR